MTVRLSNLQYATLRVFSDRTGNFHMSIEEAQG